MRDDEAQRLAAGLIRTHKAVGVAAGALAGALQALAVQPLPAGTALYREGAPSDELKVLMVGTVSVEVGEETRVVATLQSPTILGHLGVLTGLPRSATVRAADDVVMGTITADAMWRLLDARRPESRAFRRLLLASMAGLLASTNQRVARQIAETDAATRTATHAATQGGGPAGGKRPPSRRQRLHAAGERGDWGFDQALLEAAEEVQIVQTRADRDRRYKKHS